MTTAHRPRAVLATATALATATVLAATTAFLAVPATAADGGPGVPPSAIGLTDGTLDWGLKESFRRYVTGPIGGGEITVDGGAERNEDGTFKFTGGEGSYDTGTHDVELAFDGSVRFTAHHGALDLTFADLKLSTDGQAGSVTADVTASGETSDDVELATLDLSGRAPGGGEEGEMSFEDIPATLTADGATAFNGFYQEGDALDPLDLTVRPDAGSGGTGGSTSGGSSEASGGTSGTSGTSGSTGSTGSAGAPGGSGQPGPDATDATDATNGTEEADEPGRIADGTLDWGVKKSFRDYVTGPIGGGRVELTGGAEENGESYRFPHGTGEYDQEAPSLDAGFDGAVRFLAHKEAQGHALDLTFSDFRVEAESGKATLAADVATKDRESGKTSEYDDLAIANLSLPAGSLTPAEDVITLADVPATLTTDGAKAFGGFYQPGDALDPVTIAVSLDEDAQLPGASGAPGSSGGDSSAGSSAGTAGGSPATVGGSGALASTGSGLPVAGVLGGSAVLVTIGAAAAYATRRRTAAGS